MRSFTTTQEVNLEICLILTLRKMINLSQLLPRLFTYQLHYQYPPLMKLFIKLIKTNLKTSAIQKIFLDTPMSNSGRTVLTQVKV